MDIRELDTYELISEEELKDIHSVGYLLHHKKSGARIALISCDDENKVFSIAFRTPPEDSTGVAHILEHSVLCGSRDFPVKDPFVELVKGSLNTFLNAMTYPDKTVYPVASCNDKDFQNLMHVYLDAVFYPNIYSHDEIFRQEGWSYELSGDELVYNGVVYSEMKGAFSSPDGVLDREIFNSLFPDTCYGVESGGDPDVIPELSYRAFLDFHKRYYHPSNSYIYLYGNMDMVKKLKWIDENYLSRFDACSIESEVALQEPFDKLRSVSAYYPVSDEEPIADNTYLSYNKVIGDVLDERLMCAFDILDYAMLQAPGAPLEIALLKAGIGKDISGSFESEVRQPFYSISARNANIEDRDRFIKVIEDTLDSLVRDGVDRDALLAGINYYEFRTREADFGHFPKGLMYGLQMLDSWLYAADRPFLELHSLSEYSWHKEQIDTGYFEGLIKRYLLDNQHGSVVTVEPVRGLAAERDRKLEYKLKAFKESLTAGQLEDISKSEEELRQYQEAEDKQEDVLKIPILDRSDIRREVRPFSNKVSDAGGVKLIYHDYDTNGISYIRILFDLNGIPDYLWPYVSILQSVLGVIDTEHYAYGRLSNLINLETGGIGTELNTYGEYGDGNEKEFHPYFEIKAKTLAGCTAPVFKYTREFLCCSRLDDTERLKEIMSQNKARLQMKFQSAGHQAAVMRSMSFGGGAARFKDTTEGIAFYDSVKMLEESFDKHKDELVRVLMYLAGLVFRRDRMMVSFTGNPGEIDSLSREICDFSDALNSVPDKAICLEDAFVNMAEEYDGKTKAAKREGFFTASKVQYVAVTGNFRDAGLPFSGAMNVLRPVLSYDYLWNNIRVKGKAYGCMSGMARNGDGYFVTYRDPHLTNSIKVFKGVPDFLEHFDVNERDMTKYIIGAVSDLDIPLSAVRQGDRSLNAYLTKTPIEALQKERDQILDAKPSDIRALASQAAALIDEGRLCVIGGEEKLKNNSELFDDVTNLL